MTKSDTVVSTGWRVEEAKLVIPVPAIVLACPRRPRHCRGAWRGSYAWQEFTGFRSQSSVAILHSEAAARTALRKQPRRGPSGLPTSL